MDPASLFAGMIFGCIGFGYFIYGKKQANIVAMFSGVMLSALPYFISHLFVLYFMSLLLMALPIAAHKYF